METEALELGKLLQKKSDLDKELVQSQQKYMNGVNDLNRLRKSALRQNLLVLEKSVDYTRETWVELFKKSQLLDKKIDAQRDILQKNRIKLREVEKLEEKYELEFHQYIEKIEQNKSDDLSLLKKYQKL